MAKFPKKTKVTKTKPTLSGSTSIRTAMGKTNPYLPSHPMNDPTNEAALIKHIKARMDNSAPVREMLYKRLCDIDVQISGFVQPETPEDKKREQMNKQGKKPRPVDHNIPLTAAQIDEGVTYLASVFAPNGDLFEAVAPPGEQELSKAFARYVNKNGERVGYYNELVKFLTNALKYNIAAIEPSWEVHQGTVWGNDAAGEAQAQRGTIWSGNYLKNIDMYNFMYDASVHPTDLALRGEFYATFKMITPFRARKMEQDRQIFDVDKFIEERATFAECYYRSKPDVRKTNNNSNGGDNWVGFLSQGEMNDASPNIEMTRYTGWLNPKEFGISDDDRLTLVDVTIANMQHVCATAILDDSAGMLPCFITTPIIDDLENEQRTFAEQLIPFQHFASFLLNSHQDSVRKSLGGLKFYNPNIFPGMDKQHEDLYSALIPMKATGMNFDIDKAFRVYNDAPKTEQNVQDVERVINLMQQILPTDMLRQVAGLDRATMFQTAATVQAGNRRQLKIARLIYTQAMTPLKRQMCYNIYANQEIVNIHMPDGQDVEILPKRLRELQLELEMAGGIKGLDRMIVMSVLSDILNKVLQSQQAINEIDIVKMIAYVASIAGEDIDITQFRRQTPAPAQPGTAPDGTSPVTPGGPEQPPTPQG